MSPELERALARVLFAADPVAELQSLQDQELAPATRTALAQIDPDGLRIAGLLVVKLRFERLLNGSRLAGEWFERDPAGFSSAFRRYHTAIVPRAACPVAEAQAFHDWTAEQGPA